MNESQDMFILIKNEDGTFSSVEERIKKGEPIKIKKPMTNAEWLSEEYKK